MESSESCPDSAFEFDRHAEHRQRRHRRRHAGQMGGTAGAGDDDLEAGRLGALGEVIQPVGRAVGRDDPRVVRDAQRFQRFGGVAHGRPVGLAAHDDGDVGALMAKASVSRRKGAH